MEGGSFGLVLSAIRSFLEVGGVYPGLELGRSGTGRRVGLSVFLMLKRYLTSLAMSVFVL